MNDLVLPSLFTVLNMILLYFLKYKILDFISRIVQNLNKPFDYLAAQLSKSFVSKIRLSYRQKVLNFSIVLFALILVISEFSTLNEVIKGISAKGLAGIDIMGINIGWSAFSAVAYISISTLLGFIALELIDFKQLLQGILFNDSDSGTKVISQQAKIIAIILFLLLAILAILQGGLALYRYEELASSDSSTAIEKYKIFIVAFYFLLGFLTPIVAAIAFVSLDIFLAIVFSFAVIAIRFLQKIISGVFYAIETVIMITSSPVDKILEFFGLFQPQNINQINKGTAKTVVKWAPLQNNNPLYKENRSDLYDNYNYGIRRKNKILFVCENPIINLSYPSEIFPLKLDFSISEINALIKTNFPVLEEKEINYYFINTQGVLERLSETNNLNDLLKTVDYINIEIDENGNAYQQQI